MLPGAYGRIWRLLKINCVGGTPSTGTLVPPTVVGSAFTPMISPEMYSWLSVPIQPSKNQTMAPSVCACGIVSAQPRARINDVSVKASMRMISSWIITPWPMRTSGLLTIALTCCMRKIAVAVGPAASAIAPSRKAFGVIWLRTLRML
ncbi:hypothetical protein D3C87_928000 [compost metagenome]